LGRGKLLAMWRKASQRREDISRALKDGELNMWRNKGKHF
jgi:hypothetical protein